MQTRSWTVSALTALMFHVPPHVAAAEPRPESAIERTAEAYRKAVLAGDAAAVSATYGRDAVEMRPGCPALKGRPAIERYYRDLFGGPTKVTDFTFTLMGTAAAGNIGFTAGAYRLRLLPKSGEALEDSGSFVVIVKREARSWKSAYVIYNSDRPPAMAGTMVPGLISPFPALVNYYSAIAFQWLFRFALFALGCVCFGLIVRFMRSLIPAKGSPKAGHSQGETA